MITLTAPQNNFINLAGFHIHYYSICIFTALIVCYFLLIHFSKVNIVKAKTDIIENFSPYLIFWGIIGARLYYVLLTLDYYIQNPISALMIWQGGIAIHGAILGGIICGLFYFKKHKLNFMTYADSYALILPLGQAIGRWGNFFNEEAYGKAIEGFAPFYLYISKENRPLNMQNSDYFHPAFLYESIADLFIFLILYLTAKKTAKKSFDGLIFGLYILLYSSARAVIEFIRIDSVSFIFNIPTPAFISFAGIITGIIIIFKVCRHYKP